MVSPAKHTEIDAQHLAVLESVPVALVISDRAERIVFANAQARALLGENHRDLVGRDLGSLRADPRYEIGSRPIAAPGAALVLSTIVDVTQRLLTEQATARLAAIVKFSHVGMIAFLPDGTITDWNPAADRLYGYTAQEMIGGSVLRLTPPELLGQSRDIVARVTAGETVDIETERMHKSGKRIPISLTASPIMASDGRVVGITSIGRDITQRVLLEEKLRKANDELKARARRLVSQARQLKDANLALERSNLELQQFAYVASHDLQAPLRSINGFLQFLVEDYGDRLDEQGHEWIRRALDSVTKLQTLIKDLLSYARVDSRGQPFRPVDMSALFDDTKRLLAASIEEAGARVERDELPTVEGDWTQLGRVLENLIGNALKYRGDAAPVIRMTAEDQGDHWRFAVHDNGIGIDPQFHEQIFEIFKRLHTDADYPGTGIGLAICRRVINRHQGELSLESAEGQGSVFYFTLPKPDGSTQS